MQLSGRELLLCVSQEATGWINIHVEQQQMPLMLLLPSSPLTSHHLLTPHVPHPPLSLFFNEDHPHLLLPLPPRSLSISLLFRHLPSLCSVQFSHPLFPASLLRSLLYSVSPLIMRALLLAVGPAAYPPHSVVVPPDYFSGGGGASCVCAPPYCVI